MATWTQYTKITEGDACEIRLPIERTADRMVEMLAQVSFLRQAGHDVELHCETDINYRVTQYTVTRKYNGKVVENIFWRHDD